MRRFSLLTLLFAALLAGSAAALHRFWAPWGESCRLKDDLNLGLSSFAISPDGAKIVASSDDEANEQIVIRAWSAATGRELWRTAFTGAVSVYDDRFQFSRDNRWIFFHISGQGLCSQVFEAETGRGLFANPYAIAFVKRSDNDRRWLAIHDDEEDPGNIEVWDGDAGVKLRDLENTTTLEGSISPNGRYVISNHILFDLETGQEKNYRDIYRWLFTGEFSPDSTALATVPEIGRTMVLACASQQVLFCAEDAMPDQFSPDGRWLVMRPHERSLFRILELPGFKPFGPDLQADQCFFSDDSQYALMILRTSSGDDTKCSISCYRTSNWEKIFSKDQLDIGGGNFTYENGHFLNSGWWSLNTETLRLGPAGSVSPDRRILVDSHGIFDARSGERLFFFSPNDKDALFESAIFPDSRHILTAPTQLLLSPVNTNPAIVWEYRRPEEPWGFVCLPYFWSSILFAFAFLWSLRKDWKTLRRPTPAVAS
ncbi:MAG: WD40 repeat domain-containing protein [Planctomycetes bacterium]|nr:WD40 repeat domain-containing protein [Planctomycetota bacterium]